MKIDCELDEAESALLLLMLGAGTASLKITVFDIDRMLSIVNKLMQQNPNFTPYRVFTEKSVH